eukprot:33184-Pleurochrysis_carterae.AAC.1
MSPCRRSLPLSGARCPGCPAAVCCVCCSHAFPYSRLWDRMFGFASEGGRVSRSASLTASARAALLEALALP